MNKTEFMDEMSDFWNEVSPGDVEGFLMLAKTPKGMVQHINSIGPVETLGLMEIAKPAIIQRCAREVGRSEH